MDKRNVPLLFFVFVLMAGQLLGQPGTPIYVSTFTATGGQILRVDGTTKPPPVVYTRTANFRPEDITVGPDNNLYVCDPTNGLIIRMDKDHREEDGEINVETVYQATSLLSLRPQGPRFNSAGTLFFNTKGSSANGVWKIEGLTSIPLGDLLKNGDGTLPTPINVLPGLQPCKLSPGEGLAFTINGDLLIASRSDIGSGQVQLYQGPVFDPRSACDKTKTIISSLFDPIGIAVNSVGDIFVARGSLPVNNQYPENSPYVVQRFTLTSNNTVSSQTTYVDFSDTQDQPNYLEFSSDDTLFVATTDATQKIGKLWKLPPGSKPDQPIATFEMDPTMGVVVPGVGVPATSKSITWTFNGTKSYNFGSNFFEITAGACTATVTACQRPPKVVNEQLAASSIIGTVQPLSGEEGWATTWLVNASADCLPGSGGLFGIAIGSYVNASRNISPGTVRCSTQETASCTDPLTDCTLLPDFGYFLFPQEALGDPVTTTRSNSFSEYLFVNLAQAQNGEPLAQSNFCGILSPLNPDIKNPALFSIGQTIPFKFQVTKDTGCTGGFITDAQAVLSVAQIQSAKGAQIFIRMNISPAGNANQPPVFRYDKTLNQYVFNLKNSKAAGWTAGLYSAIITSNKFLPQKILFRLK